MFREVAYNFELIFFPLTSPKWDLGDDDDWLNDNGVRDFTAPVHIGLIKRALCAPYPIQGSPAALLKLHITPKLVFLMSSGSRK